MILFEAKIPLSSEKIFKKVSIFSSLKRKQILLEIRKPYIAKI
jgi:hypothetical protein